MFCRACPNQNLSDIFPVISLGLCILWEEVTEVRCHSPRVVSKVHTCRHVNNVGVSLNHLIEIVLVRPLHSKVTHFPPFYIIPLSWSPSPQGVLSMGYLSVPLHLLFSCHLYQDGLNDIYFILWVMIHDYFLKFCCPNCSCFGHLELFQWVLCPFVPLPPSLCVLNFLKFI